ncbi:MAG: hypoxanthine phosphoribosyltransferase [Desulfarculaceae bacterium]|nr:hypoxanthine phosphoribosyltransferase [Desulfarculaceae bacterium]MCF8071915.1 hypoxanthine phosphoribosyltransferase [Desulfarculaceae bacterium]MCF8103715.1 hypoxanthine phosphoribosyltransferase [Desulfarculaceae bacterium]MCF8114982.1 hypoxanthine phosphoribosyltransferase [Desulfarculaceae bacterium]
MSGQSSIKLVFSPEVIQRRVQELAAHLAEDYADTEPVVLGVLKGCFIFMSDLVRRLNLPVEVDFVRLSSYGASDTSSGTVEMTTPPSISLEGRPVLVVEDIVDTGRTLSWLQQYLESLGPSSVRFCVLVDKAERRELDFDADYVGFHVPKGFLVGYGLDYDERYRFLPGIYEITGQESS